MSDKECRYKFRAWDKQTKDMLEFFAPSMEFYNKRLNRYRDFFDRHIIQMQYTGLKDSNGKEIYEGDVIRDNDGFLWVVYFEDGMYCAKGGEYETVEHLIEFCPEWCEVIGNIYEHPHLLGGEEE